MRRVLVGLVAAAMLSGCAMPFGILGKDPAGKWKVEGAALYFTIKKFGTDWSVEVPTDAGMTGSGKFDGSSLDVTFTNVVSGGDTFHTNLKGSYGADGKIAGSRTDSFKLYKSGYQSAPSTSSFTSNHE